MRLDLSSQITLERVPKKYYKPDNDFEEYNLARYEKLPVAIFEKSSRASKKIARDIVKDLQKNEKAGKPFVLGISGGASPVPVYEELVRMHKEEGVSFKNLTVFNTYEFYPGLEFSYINLKMLKDIFLDKIDIDPKNIFSPDSTVEKDLISEVCEDFEKQLKERGGIDYLLLGLGSKGNVGFNMPGSSLHSQTRLVMLDGDSRADIARNFESLDKVPVSAITMGLYDMIMLKDNHIDYAGGIAAAIENASGYVRQFQPHLNQPTHGRIQVPGWYRYSQGAFLRSRAPRTGQLRALL